MTIKPLLLILCVALFSCKQEKSSGKENNKQAAGTDKTMTEKRIQGMLDSIKAFKPLKLSINEEHSDVDELIPLGYNNHGSFAYLINENSGASSGLHFGIVPAYEDFTLDVRLDRDEEPDTILQQNKELLYHALQSQGVRLLNSVRKITLDSLQKNYGYKVEVKKVYGAPGPDDPSGKKTLASVEITWRQGETLYPSELINRKFNPGSGIYDVYISDYLVIPGQEGLFGFVILVTEGFGFEGYIRKSIELMQIGVVKGL